MVPNKGLYLDCKEIDQPEGTWRNARNLVHSKSKGAFTNEDGTAKLPIPTDVYATQAIGVKSFPDGSKVVWSAGATSRIGILDKNNVYTDLIIDSALNHSLDYPIRSAETDYNYLQQRIVAYTDKYNLPRIINLDDLPFDLNIDLSLVNPEELSNINLFPTFSQPSFSFTVNETGGSVRSGNYSVCGAYENNDGTRTVNTLPIKNISIIEDVTVNGFDAYDGIAPDTLTGKSINFTITDVDTRYDKFVLIIVARRNNIVTTFEVKKINITGSTITTAYLGTETETPLDLTEILTPRPLYNKVGCMTQLNGRLYLADLETSEDIDFQPFANNVKLHYNTRRVTVNTLTDSQKVVFPGGFAHGGIYAFYITLLLTNGSKSRAFHIPGRPIIDGSDIALQVSTVAAAQGITAKKYQIEDTTNAIAHDYINDSGTIRSDTRGLESNMGYWENTNETYPTGFPALEGYKVRHHVFPTIRRCKQLHYNGRQKYGITEFDILGIDVSNVQIPAEIQPFVTGWYISYAQRDYVNSNTLGTDIFITAHTGKSDLNHFASAGGNWNTRSFTSGGSNWAGSVGAEDFKPDPVRIKGHNFDLLYDKPNVGNSLFLDFELKLRKNNAAANYRTVGKLGGNLTQSGQGEGQNASAVLDLTDDVNVIASLPAAQTIRRVTDYRYLPTNIIDSSYHTIKNEEAIHITVSNATTSLYSESQVDLNSTTRTPNNFIGLVSPFINGGEDTYLMSYKVVRSDLYNEFDQQLLITTDQVVTSAATVEKLDVYGGDHFVSTRSFICSSPRFTDDETASDQLGTIIFRNHITENRHNVGLRYEIVGDVTSKYYPKTRAVDFFTNPDDPDEDGVLPIFDRTKSINGIAGYSTDYNAVNELNQSVIFNEGQVTTGIFPYRVIRSGFAGSSQTGLNSWKTFLSADYYESNRSRGRIENIVGIDDTLFIHHLYGLFHTIGSQKLALGATEVFLGTDDIFSQVPKEPVSTKLGYLGTQNIFSCFTFKGFYAWADQSQGRFFYISKQGVVEISNAGLYNILRDTLKINNNLPNAPITGEAIIGGFDPKYNRLLFTKKSNTTWFTLSYSLETNCWISYHDYKPNMYFNDTTELYAFDETGVYKHNVETSKGMYYNQIIPYPCYLDIVFNQNARDTKLFFNVNWNTELYDSEGNLVRDKTLTHLTVSNAFQTTGRVTLVPFVNLLNKGNIRRTVNEWNFNKVKHNVVTNVNRTPIISEYALVRYEYDNQPNLDLSQNSLYLYAVSANFRFS
jgi:hypothetical protein